MFASLFRGALAAALVVGVSFADESDKKPEAKEEKKLTSPITADQVEIKDGTPAELQNQFRESMVVARRNGLNQQDTLRLQVFTAGKIMEKVKAHKDATAAQKNQAVSLYYQGLQIGSRQDPKTFESLAAAFEDDYLKNEPKGMLAGQIKVSRFSREHLKNGELKEGSMEKLLAFAAEQKDNAAVAQLFTSIAQGLSNRGKQEEGIKLMEQGMKILSPAAAKAGRLAGALAKLKIIGSQIEIAGPTVTGTEFDIKSLRGKVVLVDFWATWCGPCIAEIPNVKKVYEKYHDKGFEIVGISFDNEKEPLEKYIKENEMPWTQIIFPDKKDMGWNNPLGQKFGVSGIPQMYLVGKDGKVITEQLRGENRKTGKSLLEEAVEKALGLDAPKGN